MRNTMIFCGFLLTLAACGTKGPLVLPPLPPASTPPAATPAPVDDSTAPGVAK